MNQQEDQTKAPIGSEGLRQPKDLEQQQAINDSPIHGQYEGNQEVTMFHKIPGCCKERPIQCPARTVNHYLDQAVPRSHRHRTIHDRPILYVDKDSRKQFDAKNGVVHGY